MSRDRDRWLKQRSTGIGASEAAAVVGVSPFAGPLEVYARKVGLVKSKVSTQAMEAGNRLEPVVAKWFSDDAGLPVENLGKYKLVRLEDRPHIFCTPDRVIPSAPGREGPGALQIKTTSEFLRDDWEHEPPLHVQIQNQQEMACLGYKWGVCAALIGGNKLKYHFLDFHAGFVAGLVDTLTGFWDMVQRREEPAVQYLSDAKLIERLYPNSTGDLIEVADADLDIADLQLEGLKAEIKEMTDRRKLLEARIKQAIGSHEGAVLPSGTVYMHKEQERKEYTVPAKSFRVLRRRKAR